MWYQKKTLAHSLKWSSLWKSDLLTKKPMYKIDFIQSSLYTNVPLYKVASIQIKPLYKSASRKGSHWKSNP